MRQSLAWVRFRCWNLGSGNVERGPIPDTNENRSGEERWIGFWVSALYARTDHRVAQNQDNNQQAALKELLGGH